MTTNTSREAVERLAESIVHGDYAITPEGIAATLRALLARCEKAEAERDQAVADELAHSAAVNRAEAERDEWVAVATQRLALLDAQDAEHATIRAERDAARAERDKLNIRLDDATRRLELRYTMAVMAEIKKDSTP